MPKLVKKVTDRENKCKNMHLNMNMAGLPTKLEPKLFVVMDTDALQKQVNALQYAFERSERAHARRKWKGK